MYLPYKNNESPIPGLIGSFGGLNKGVSISENEFSDMENLSSDDFPQIGTRERRNLINNFIKQTINGQTGEITKLVHNTENYTLTEKQISITAPKNPKVGDKWARIVETTETRDAGTENEREVIVRSVDKVFEWNVHSNRSFNELLPGSWEAGIDPGQWEVKIKYNNRFVSIGNQERHSGTYGKINYSFILDNDTDDLLLAQNGQIENGVTTIPPSDFIVFEETVGNEIHFSRVQKKSGQSYVDAVMGEDYIVQYSPTVTFDGKTVPGGIWEDTKISTDLPTDEDANSFDYFIQTNEDGIPIRFFAVYMKKSYDWGIISDFPSQDFTINRKDDGSYNVSKNHPTAFCANGQWAYSTVDFQGNKRLLLSAPGTNGEKAFDIGSIFQKGEYAAAKTLSEHFGIDEAVLREAEEKRQIVTMGAKVVLFPEMYYINMYDTNDRGFLYNKRYPLWKAGYANSTRIKISPCLLDGQTIKASSMGVNPPSNPENGDVWLDISGTSSDYKMFDGNSKSWNSIATTYLKIQSKGAFEGFKQWDTIFIDGFEPGAVVQVNKNSFGVSDFLAIDASTRPYEDYISSYEEYMEERISYLGEDVRTVPSNFAPAITTLNAFGDVLSALPVLRVQPHFSEKQTEELWEEYVENGGVKLNEHLVQQIKDLNGKYYTIQQCTEDYIVVIGLLDATVKFAHVTLPPEGQGGEYSKEYGKFSFERRVPLMDYYCECNNRIWGCRFGLDEEGNTVNEIMACKFGDPTNWYSFNGISTDSFQLTLGSDGDFTGCVNFNGYPTFFKQKYVHKIYGSTPTSFQLVTNNLRGVGKGMGESLVICNNRLFYATANELVMYDGASVYTISSPLGKLDFDSCISGTDQKKIYFLLKKESAGRTLYVYDTELDLFHKEDAPDILFFANDGSILYFIERYFNTTDGCIRYRFKSVGERTDTIKIIENGTVFPIPDDDVNWWAETGELGFADPFGKYIQKISVRAKVDEGAEYHVEIAYDGGEFEPIRATNHSEGIRARDFVFRIRRCDYFKLRFSGKGKVTFISIYKSYVQGSDKK